MEKQSRYIAELRNEIYTLKGQCTADAHISQGGIKMVEDNCKKVIEQNFIKHESTQMLRDKRIGELSENIIQMFQQLSRNQIATIESALKENMLRICSHKAFIESISQSLLQGIQKPLEEVFKRSLKEHMIPSYEKITHEMFQEMGRAFSAGTKEYTRTFDLYMKQYGPVQHQMGEFVKKIPQEVRASTELLLPHMNTGFAELRQHLDKLQVRMLNDLKERIRTEIYNGFEIQKMNIEDSVLSVVQRSQAETPAPQIHDPLETIKQLLAHGQIDKAFHAALITSDLSMLEFTLEKADFKTVFNPCPLGQSVLLSLIQQITADMSKYSELKNRQVMSDHRDCEHKIISVSILAI